MISRTEGASPWGKRGFHHKGFASILVPYLAFLSLVLAACSSDGSSDKALGALKKTALSRFTSPEPIVAPDDKPFAVVTYRGGSTPMVLLKSQDHLSHYESPDGVKMTLNDVFLARLRGLGQEFEALYLEGSLPDFSALADGSLKTASMYRIMEYWENQQPKRDYLRCHFSKTQTVNTTVQESCESIYGFSQFNNTYEMNRNGSVVKSLQWFHPKADSLEIYHLPRVTSGSRL